MNRIAYGLAAVLGCCGLAAAQGEIQYGIAREFPGDVGIDQHPSVVFVEDFEAESLEQVIGRWNWARGAEDGLISLDSDVEPPPGSTGSNRLKMTIRRGQGGTSGDLRKILDAGYDEIYFRFYARFAEDYGFMHHFTRIRGERNPTPYMMGGAGSRPETNFGIAIETSPRPTPPGHWYFYTYWPEMRSYQNPDGTGTRFYGNNLFPQKPVAVERGQWQCIEIMVRLNSGADSRDGALALWIDGEAVGRWDPKDEQPVRGYWIRDTFRSDPDHASAADFDGFNWTPLAPEERDNFKNVIQLHHYVSASTWERADTYASQNPQFPINLQEATIWKDHVVVATEYIGPLAPPADGE